MYDSVFPFMTHEFFFQVVELSFWAPCIRIRFVRDYRDFLKAAANSQFGTKLKSLKVGCYFSAAEPGETSKVRREAMQYLLQWLSRFVWITSGIDCKYCFIFCNIGLIRCNSLEFFGLMESNPQLLIECMTDKRFPWKSLTAFEASFSIHKNPREDGFNLSEGWWNFFV